MSNKVQVTIVAEADETTIYHKQGERLLDTLVSQGGYVLASCGGRGTCGQCVVQFLAGIPLPSHADRAYFSPEQLRSGYRLACMAKPMADCKLKVCFQKQKKMEIALDTANAAGWRKDSGMLQCTKDIEHAGKGADGGRVTRCFIAVDLGTTTIAMQLVSLVTGEKLATYAVVNPQRSFGTDVISRIDASNHGKREELCKLVRRALEAGIVSLIEQAKKQYLDCEIDVIKHGDRFSIIPEYMIIAGNTTMGHLFMGYDTTSLGVHPFAPVKKGWIKTRLKDTPTILMPGISAFVGGDIVSGIYASGIAETEEVNLLIDLGTNGEMAIGNRHRILCTATAAGPAFEGRITGGIFATDIIKITADMLRKGVMDETGLLAETYFEAGYTVKLEESLTENPKLCFTGENIKKQSEEIRIQQQDIRALQMAKAAVYAGVQILIKQYGIRIDQISHVYLAGGFGMKLQVEDAARIGLFPEELQHKIAVVMNSSLRGACMFGMQKNYDVKVREYTVTQEKAKEAIEYILAVMEEINLAKQPEFEDIYIENLNFPVR